LTKPRIELLHRERHRFVRILKVYNSNSNTDVVVEHDPKIDKEADHILDLGPLAGEKGGEVVFAGPYAKLLRDKRSLTGKYLTGRLEIPLPQRRQVSRRGHCLTILGASANNLKNLDVEIPLGCMVCITGVSG